MPARALTDFLHHNPLFVLFAVAASGFLLGKLKVWGFSFGVAAVLFAGLFLGALVPGVEDLPNIGYTTVYPLATIGKIVLGQALLFWLR